MAIRFGDDIRSVTGLKRHTREILSQTRQTGRPVILTVNGRADSVLTDARTYEWRLKAGNLSRLLLAAEKEVLAKRTRPARAYLREFKRARKIQGLNHPNCGSRH